MNKSSNQTFYRHLLVLVVLFLGVGKEASAAPPPFPIGAKFSRTVQKVTGINAVTQFTASHVAGLVLSRKLGGQVKTKIRTYSLTDLIAGKVKSLEITAKESAISGVKIGYLHVKSAQPIWLRWRKKGSEKPGIACPVMLSLEGHISQDQVSQALETPKVANALSALRLDLPGLGEQRLQILEPKVKIDKGKVEINAFLVTQGARRATGVPLTISATPVLQGDAKICLTNTSVSSPDIQNPEEFAAFFTELFNPLVNFARMDRLDHAFRMQSLRVEDKQVSFNGRLVLAPKPKPMVAEKVSK